MPDLQSWVVDVESRLRNLGKREKHGPGYVGTDLEFWSVSTPNFRALIRQIADDLPQSWEVCADALWQRPIYDVRILAILLAANHAGQFRKTHWNLLAGWMKDASGWAMVDTLCCEALAPLLKNYPELADKTGTWPRSRNLWMRRASLVAFCVPVRHGELSERAFNHAAALLEDRDPMVVKAESWLLRSATKHFKSEVESFLRSHESEMAPLILREVRTKMATGRKTNKK
jgi:3-methyladenine DNA glycosylase AlkD